MGLDAGRYRVTSFQPQCGPAGCEESGPEPERRAVRTRMIDLVGGLFTRVVIRVRYDGCSMEVGKPLPLVIPM